MAWLALLIVAVLAWWIFGEAVDHYTALGAAIIIGASLYIAQREHALARQRRASTPQARAEPPI